MSRAKQPAKPPTPIHWSTGDGDDYGWMVGRVEASDVVCRFSHRHWQVFRLVNGERELVREGLVEDHQVSRATAKQQRVVSLYEVCERIAEANARKVASVVR